MNELAEKTRIAAMKMLDRIESETNSLHGDDLFALTNAASTLIYAYARLEEVS